MEVVGVESVGIQHYTIISLSTVRCVIQNIICFIKGSYLLDEEKEYHIRLILNELISNSFIHGNRRQEGKKIQVWVKVKDPFSVKILVEDEGNGFDYQKMIRNCLQHKKMDCLMEGGRGLMLVDALSEEMRFSKKGNRVLVKVLI